jgi:hypothetical protein
MQAAWCQLALTGNGQGCVSVYPKPLCRFAGGNIPLVYIVKFLYSIAMFKNRNTGGRPPKKIEEKKSYRVTTKMNTKEYYTLMAKAQSAGMTMPEFVRESVAHTNVIARIQPEEAGIIRDLCGMATNLNQLAHKANAGGFAKAAIECTWMAREIINLLNSIKDVRKSNGKNEL